MQTWLSCFASSAEEQLLTPVTCPPQPQQRPRKKPERRSHWRFCATPELPRSRLPSGHYYALLRSQRIQGRWVKTQALYHNSEKATAASPKHTPIMEPPHNCCYCSGPALDRGNPPLSLPSALTVFYKNKAAHSTYVTPENWNYWCCLNQQLSSH